jgi:glycolate oxidase
MELNKEAYRTLEDIVGPEYITQELAYRDTYNQVWGNMLVYGQKWSKRPAAILLPATTEEVSAIVKICNRYHILFKPFSSGFEVMATSVESENSIILDLKRMNRILEIDSKNMLAVVEPYVSVYRLQIEAAKCGVMMGNIGAGPNAGVVAAIAAHFGSGETMVSTSGLDRNLLGCEWVLPTGEILRLGSSESGDGWYSADGPGLSLRGLLRGRAGANGGHGVITKVSAKLYPWYGPPEWEFVRDEGRVPSHRYPKQALSGYKAFVITFPSLDHMYDAVRDTAQAEILHSMWTFFQGGGFYPEGNDEELALRMQGSMEERLKMDLSAAYTIAANSQREMAYKEGCLLKICDRLGGKKLPEFNRPEDLAQIVYNRLFSFDTPAIFRRHTMMVSPCSEATQDFLRRQHALFAQEIEPYMQKGFIDRFGAITKAIFHNAYENYGVGLHQECVYGYDSDDPVSLEGALQYTASTFDPEGIFRRYQVAGMGGGLQIESATHAHQNWGPNYDNYDIWLRKIKAMLDPQNVADWSAYIPPAYPKKD